MDNEHGMAGHVSGSGERDRVRDIREELLAYLVQSTAALNAEYAVNASDAPDGYELLLTEFVVADDE